MVKEERQKRIAERREKSEEWIGDEKNSEEGRAEKRGKRRGRRMEEGRWRGQKVKKRGWRSCCRLQYLSSLRAAIWE